MKWVWISIVWCAQAQTAPPKETFQTAMEKQRASIELQRQAVRKQAETVAQWRSGEPPGAEIPEAGVQAGVQCDAMPDAEMAPIIESAAKAQQVQAKLLRGVIEQESGFKTCAVSVKGAKGLMQLMPATIEQFGVDDPFDARQNIDAGAKFLKQLLDKYKGDLSLALSAYNSGPGTVDQAGGIPNIKETRDYVDAIMKKVK